MKILVINGPNLNMLEYRDKSIYGSKTLNQINEEIESYSTGHEILFYQSNHEGCIIDKIHEAIEREYDGIIINPGAFAHYSYAICDALEMFNNMSIEVHLSDIDNREEFRKNLITAKSVDKVISGIGFEGYLKAVDYILENGGK